MLESFHATIYKTENNRYTTHTYIDTLRLQHIHTYIHTTVTIGTYTLHSHAAVKNYTCLWCHDVKLVVYMITTIMSQIPLFHYWSDILILRLYTRKINIWAYKINLTVCIVHQTNRGSVTHSCDLYRVIKLHKWSQLCIWWYGNPIHYTQGNYSCHQMIKEFTICLFRKVRTKTGLPQCTPRIHTLKDFVYNNIYILWCIWIL